MSEDLSHDTHLRAALRHAPDHALVPPAGLSQTILAAARRVHRPVRAASAPPPVRVTLARARPLSIVLQWLSSPRHAGSLATALVGALGLGLWLDLGVQPVIERPVAPASPAPSEQRESDATAVTPTPPPAAAAQERAEAQAPAREAAPVTALPTPPAAATKRAARPAQGATPDKAETQQTRRNEAPPPSAAIDEIAAAAKPAQPAPTPSAAPAPPAAAAAGGRVATMPSGEAVERLMRRDSASDLRAYAAPRAALPGVASPESAATVAEPAAAASPALTLLRRARGELASGAARWDWQAPGASGMAPLDDAAQAWLLSVVQLARGRWTDVTERAATGDAIEVRWWRDGWPHATLRIESEGLRWLEPSGRIRYAPMEAAALQRLRNH